MRKDDYQSPHDIKAKQTKILLIVCSVVLVILLGIYYLMGDESGSASKTPDASDTISFSSAVDKVNPQSVWLEHAQNQMHEQQKKTDELQQQLTQMKSEANKQALANDPTVVAMKEEIDSLKKMLNEKMAPPVNGKYAGQVLSTVPGAITGQSPDGVETAGIDIDELHLSPATHQLPKKNPDSFVPAGTFAEAIMLGAADASAGVNSSANPSPMLFRIIANGTLPNHKKSHLKDCVATAAVVGDISSERGQIRLERLSCTFSNGEIVEQPVEGTVFGMDAKNGVRGNPVWREGTLLGRAAVAGTLSGIGSAVSQTYTTNSISPLGNTQTVNNGEIFKYGAAQGVSTAMEKLADYNIRRAEQYHPVIQLSAGQPVDIVFLKGFYLDGKSHEDTDQDKKSEPELFPSSSHHTVTGLTLSEESLAKIKAHEASIGLASNTESGGMQ